MDDEIGCIGWFLFLVFLIGSLGFLIIHFFWWIVSFAALGGVLYLIYRGGREHYRDQRQERMLEQKRRRVLRAEQERYEGAKQHLNDTYRQTMKNIDEITGK